MLILDRLEIQNWDKFTLIDQNVSSLTLMKRASFEFTQYLLNHLKKTEETISIFCGSGNNGGDGISVAINLRNAFFNVEVYICHISEFSKDNRLMYEELKTYKDIAVYNIYEHQDLSSVKVEKIVIDGIFGTGLSRPVENYWKKLIEHINKYANTVFSIDTPSGLFTDKISNGAIIKADYCGTFQSPKLTHLIVESEPYLSKLEIIDIGLSKSFKAENCFKYYLDESNVKSIIKKRRKHAHKGDFGHTLLACGSQGMAGALILCTKSSLRSGVGKATVMIPEPLIEIIQLAVPEAMVEIYGNITNTDFDLDQFTSIATGCGIGINKHSSQLVDHLLSVSKSVLIIDADALNIISENGWQNRMTPNTVITPHIKEFERLYGKSSDSISRLQLAREKAIEHHIYIILKGAYTCISTPDGKQYFNSTGNPGMATAGSGDVLTGILAGVAAQHYSIKEACLLSVYLHGLAGDFASEQLGEHSMMASDIVQMIPKAISELSNEEN